MSRNMSTTALGCESARSAPAASSRIAGAIDRRFRDLVFRRLRDLEGGRVVLRDRGGTQVFGEETGETDLSATILVSDPRFFRQVALGGSLGAADSFIDGRWACDDLTALLRVFVRNMPATDRLERGLARALAPIRRAGRALRRNTRLGSRRNIHAHYDLGNEFFALFLDETLTYSCGIFERPESTLAEASTAKLDRLCRKLDLKPDHHLLETGTGWGSLAIHAAGNYGCRVTTTTISARQAALARERIRAAGLDSRITVLETDYRDLEGVFDRIVSIEMIEAVGHEFLDTYFGRCGALLRDDGLMAVQAITMPDQRYDAYRRSVDFIQQYVFPGSCCPSLEAMTDAVARSTDMRLVHLEDITPHYARTLREWRSRFSERREDARALGCTEEFLRLWHFYLCYCEAGFAERYIGDLQLVLAKPGSRRAPILSTLDRETP